MTLETVLKKIKVNLLINSITPREAFPVVTIRIRILFIALYTISKYRVKERDLRLLFSYVELYLLIY
jgi:hypothetical protein